MISAQDLRALADELQAVFWPEAKTTDDVADKLRSAATQLETDAETIRVQKERIERLEDMVAEALDAGHSWISQGWGNAAVHILGHDSSNHVFRYGRTTPEEEEDDWGHEDCEVCERARARKARK